MITIDDFKKLDLRVGEIIEASPVEDSEKLIKLLVDFGQPAWINADINPEAEQARYGAGVDQRGREVHQIIAGIGKKYNPVDLIGKQFIFVYNLEPRKLMGLESQGMILAVSSNEGPVLLTPAQKVQPGNQVS